jgi:hypothetical protein
LRIPGIDPSLAPHQAQSERDDEPQAAFPAPQEVPSSFSLSFTRFSFSPFFPDVSFVFFFMAPWINRKTFRVVYLLALSLGGPKAGRFFSGTFSFFCLIHPNFFGSSQAGLIGGQIWNPIPFSRVGAQKSSYTKLGPLVWY